MTLPVEVPFQNTIVLQGTEIEIGLRVRFEPVRLCFTEASTPGFAGVYATTNTGTALVGRGLSTDGIGLYAESESSSGYAIMAQGHTRYAWAG